MSGIEIAGLVLAIIPIFISAIEHYEDGLLPYKVWKLTVYRRELARYRTKLRLQYGLYNSALEELLVDVVPEQELRAMIAQGFGPTWKNPALEDKLKKRLGSVYGTYLDVMKEMQEVMARIASLLDLQNQGNVCCGASLFADPANCMGSQPGLSSSFFCSHIHQSTARSKHHIPLYTSLRRG